jgi:glycosyltransferase involved in cell wall biosynthesis
MENKKYIIFSANYLPNLGGVERYTYNLAKKLIQKGHYVTVVTSNTDKLLSYENIEGINIYRLPCINLLNGRFPVSKFNKEYIKLMKQLVKEDYDLCIVNTRFYIHSFCGVLFGKKYSQDTIVIEHGTNHFTVENRILDTLGHIYEHMITKLVALNCKNFYGVSLACNKWLEHYKIQAKGILYNAIDISNILYLLQDSKISYRDKLNIPSDGILVTYTGRLVKEKGIMKLISAVQQVNLLNKKVYLAIAGDGELIEEVSKLTSRNIILLGKIDFSCVISLLKETDIFCLPTDYPEGFPTSVLEAAACKCFIITTQSGGSKELVINDNYGIILNQNVPEEIAKYINLAILDKEYYNQAVNQVYKRCMENFTWDIISEKVIDITK